MTKNDKGRIETADRFLGYLLRVALKSSVKY
jgi:hypothetical protein